MERRSVRHYRERFPLGHPTTVSLRRPPRRSIFYQRSVNFHIVHFFRCAFTKFLRSCVIRRARYKATKLSRITARGSTRLHNFLWQRHGPTRRERVHRPESFYTSLSFSFPNSHSVSLLSCLVPSSTLVPTTPNGTEPNAVLCEYRYMYTRAHIGTNRCRDVLHEGDRSFMEMEF